MDKQSCVVLAAVFLIAGTLLATIAVTTMVPAAYADNKQKAEDESAAAIADCDKNDAERAGFDCFGIAANDIEIEGEERNGPPTDMTTTTATTATTTTLPDMTTGTEIMSNPLFNLGQNSTG
jgi:hypothetical protein